MRVKNLLELLEPKEKVVIFNQKNEEIYDGLVVDVEKNINAKKIKLSKAIKIKCNRVLIYSEEK